MTEDLNRRWYEVNTGQALTDVQRHIRHPLLRWMAATLDGRVQSSEAVFEAKFMLPWSFSEEAAVQKYMPQLQHNMWVVAARSAVLSVITGGGKWVEITTHADPLYQHLIVTAERKFWRCVESGEPPALFGVEPPKPRIAAVRIVDMSASNAWAEFAGAFTRTHPAFLEHERAKAELKGLVPEDAQQAIGHGVRAKRSKSGAITFELLKAEDGHAAVERLDWQLGGGPCEGAGRAHQSGEIDGGHHPAGGQRCGRAYLPLCPLVAGGTYGRAHLQPPHQAAYDRR